MNKQGDNLVNLLITINDIHTFTCMTVIFMQLGDSPTHGLFIGEVGVIWLE